MKKISGCNILISRFVEMSNVRSAIETNNLYIDIFMYYAKVVKRYNDVMEALGFQEQTNNSENNESNESNENKRQKKKNNISYYKNIFYETVYYFGRLNPIIDEQLYLKYKQILIEDKAIKYHERPIHLPFVKSFGNIYIDYEHMVIAYQNIKITELIKCHFTFLLSLQRLKIYLPVELIDLILSYNCYDININILSAAISIYIASLDVFHEVITLLAYDEYNTIRDKMYNIIYKNKINNNEIIPSYKNVQLLRMERNKVKEIYFT